jgi:hypothetical protein
MTLPYIERPRKRPALSSGSRGAVCAACNNASSGSREPGWPACAPAGSQTSTVSRTSQRLGRSSEGRLMGIAQQLNLEGSVRRVVVQIEQRRPLTRS